VKQLTVRGFDKDLERRLRDVAKTRGVSLNQAALNRALPGWAGIWFALGAAGISGPRSPS
jgi:hypothetical protein